MPYMRKEKKLANSYLVWYFSEKRGKICVGIYFEPLGKWKT